MRRNIILSALAIAVGVIAVTGAQLVSAAGNGGSYSIIAPGAATVGQSFDIDIALTAGPDQHAGQQVTIQYDPTLITVNSHTSLMVPTLYGAEACGTNPANNPAFQNVAVIGAPPYNAPVGFNLAQVSCVSTSGPASTSGTFARFNVTAVGAGAAAIHLVSHGAPDNGGDGGGSFGVNAADNTAQSMVLPADHVINITLPPPNVSVTKTQVEANPLVQGQTVNYNIGVNNPSTSTPATNVVATDTLPATIVDVTTSTVVCSGAGVAAGAGTATPSCTWASIPALGSETMSVGVDTNNPGTQNNSVTVTLAEADPNLANNTATASTTVIAPDVSWFKDPDSANLWVAPNAPDDPVNGVNILDIDEVVQNFGDPDGLGAFEFQLKFDDKLFELPISITESGLLGSTGRDVDCNMTILLEHLINFACASTATGPNNTPLGPTWAGNQILATIHLDAKAELIQRIRPTLNNGVVTPLFDENCELADIWGNPADTVSGPNPGPLLGGMLPGGQVDCQDAVVTIRMLEGDVDLDCDVDLTDMQGEAYRYGAFFGVQLYNKWYDLEPQIGDLDVDIKDVQFVAGRIGSTCADPLPPQAPGDIP